MPLVDYRSDSDDSTCAPDGPPPAKKPRTAAAAAAAGGPSPPRTSGPGSGAGTKPGSTLPPLPASFHDLYASTVRTTTRDDPALHQGRTRQIPHTPGAWPSHIYIEWHPPPAVHALLTGLVASLQEAISATTTTTTSAAAASAAAAAAAAAARVTSDDRRRSEEKITTFLQSDLATPQPLHISLSRPISLSSEEKDAFLRDVVDSAVGGSGLAAFGLDGTRVEWHRTGESGRSFLVLRVAQSPCSSSSTTSLRKDDDNDHDHDGDDGDDGVDGVDGADDANPNPALTELLRRCNAVVERYGQPGLYQWAAPGDSSQRLDRRVGNAFHVSIAWSFAEPTPELVRMTEKVFAGPEVRKRLREVRIPVDGVKVKIGNVVTHVALRQPGRRASEKGARHLLGL